MPKQITFRQNDVIEPRSCEPHYQSATEEGSSGSLVLNDLGEFIGLHRASCNLIEITLNEKWLDLQKEVNMFFAEYLPDKKLNLLYEHARSIRWRIGETDYQGSLIRLLKHISEKYPGLIESKKEEAWACRFLNRLNGDVALELLEKTLQIKINELRAEIEKHLVKTSTKLTLTESSDYKIEWALSDGGKPANKGNALVQLLGFLCGKFPTIFENNSIVWARLFLKKTNTGHIANLERHIFCQKATLATKIVSEIKKIDNFHIKKLFAELPPLSIKPPLLNKRKPLEPLEADEEPSYTMWFACGSIAVVGMVCVMCFACDFFSPKKNRF